MKSNFIPFIRVHFFSIFFLLIHSGVCFSQDAKEYVPLEYTSDSIGLDEKKYKQSVSRPELDALSKKAKDEVVDFFYWREKELLYEIHKKHFIKDKKFNDYLQFILNEIVKANSLPDKFKLRISRYPEPNASCDGNWNITFYIGLLKKMENEAQIAFILSHEIAHQLLSHVDNRIIETIKLKYSKDTKQDLKEIAKNEFGAAQKYIEYLKKMTYDSKRHNRDQEASADSLGMLLMLNTKYNAEAGIRDMAILDSVDTDTFTISYVTYFNSKEYPFKNSWILPNKTLGFGGKDAFGSNEDSLKTHPDCKLRAEVIKKMLADKKYSPNGKSNFIQSRELLEGFVTASKFEEIQYLYDFEHYATVLYYGLNLLEEYPDDVMIHNSVAASLQKLLNSMKDHKLHEHASKPSPDYSEYLNQLLRLLDRISIDELKGVSSNFVNLFKEKFYYSNKNFKKLYDQNSLITKY
ncbi:MAG: M48 family metallopeptidase [Bacteroidota bacterium]